MNWRTILFNGFWLLVPILVWNAIFASKLTHPAFEHDEDIAQWVLILENILRMGIFLVPLFLNIQSGTSQTRFGWIIYIIGLLFYFGTWIPLMVVSDSTWSNSLIGFTAPAWSPLIWLTGISLICGWLPYLGVSIIFVGVHLFHWAQIWKLVVG